MMFWSGIVILVIGILGAAFKGCLAWKASRDPFRGGGVPTFDFVVFWPIPIALGIGLILNAEGIASYYGAGVPLYLLIFLAFRWLHIWFDKLGKPVRERQLALARNRGSNRDLPHSWDVIIGAPNKTMLDPQILSQYVVTPLTPEEIDELERKCQREIPNPVREWLATVGAPQNVSYRLPEDESRFATIQQWVPAGYFGFATDDDLDATLVLDDQEIVYRLNTGSRNPEPIAGTFADYVLANLARPKPVETLKWHTQLSFTTDQEELVLRELSRAFSLTKLSGWEYKDTSPAQVITHINRCDSPYGDTQISRQEYHGWSEPIYYFNRAIDIEHIRELKSIFRRFEELNVGFKLINYGLLAMNDDDDD